VKVPRRGLLIALAVGMIVFGVGAGGLDLAGSRLDRLAARGVHVTATVVEADTYDAGFRFESHLIVGFRTRAGTQVRSRVWIGQESYFVGQQVPVTYDPGNPSNAQLDGDSANVGPVRFPLLVAEIVGAGFLVYVAGGGLFALIRRLLT
jgi:hypothetical protein